MSNETERWSLEDFGLDDPEVLETATRMAPPLFAALRIARVLGDDAYPIESRDAIEPAFAAVANEGDHFLLSGLQITAEAAREQFPEDFLPITDRHDLVQKVHMAIVIAHEAASREAWQLVRSGEMELEASHPIPEEVF